MYRLATLLAITGLLLAQDVMNEGVQAYRMSRYTEAVQAFQKVLESNPTDIRARLYLAQAYMGQYIPGVISPENQVLGERTKSEFLRVLDLDPKNLIALNSLTSLNYQQAQGSPDPEEKSRKLEEAKGWYQKLAAADPRSKEAFYSLGVIGWAQAYAPIQAARVQLGMRPEDPGPLPDARVRQGLRAKYESVIKEGISNLEQALQIDPGYDDAMAYTNLLYREGADLRDSSQEYQQDSATADQWVQKTLETKRAKNAQNPQNPQRIRVGANVQAANLISKVEPIYPPLAMQARIQGTVHFTAIIDRDGRVSNLQLVAGHPLLVGAARDAVLQWIYKPTLLNGSPVEVVTQADVNFTLVQ